MVTLWLVEALARAGQFEPAQLSKAVTILEVRPSPLSSSPCPLIDRSPRRISSATRTTSDCSRRRSRRVRRPLLLILLTLSADILPRCCAGGEACVPRHRPCAACRLLTDPSCAVSATWLRRSRSFRLSRPAITSTAPHNPKTSPWWTPEARKCHLDALFTLHQRHPTCKECIYPQRDPGLTGEV